MLLLVRNTYSTAVAMRGEGSRERGLDVSSNHARLPKHLFVEAAELLRDLRDSQVSSMHLKTKQSERKTDLSLIKRSYHQNP